MEPDKSMTRALDTRRVPRNRRAGGRAVLAAVLVLGTASAGVHVPLAVAQEAPAASPAPDDISGLIRAVADATARLDAARQDIAVKREGVNKTLVDLQMARVELDRASAAADTAAQERERADSGVDTARETLDDYASMLHRQGTAPGVASQILDPAGPGAAGDRQELLQRAAADQHRVVGDMVTARDEATRREAEATTARTAAEERYADASARRDAAEAEVSSVTAEVTALEQEVADLTRALEESRDSLQAAGGTPAPLPSEAGAVDIDQDAARVEAQSRLAADPYAEGRAADIAGALPSHLDLGAVRRLAAGSSDRVSQRVGGVIDTGSLDGAVDAGSVADAVSAGIDGDTDAIIQQVIDAISGTDTGSLYSEPGSPGAPTNPGGGTSPGTPPAGGNQGGDQGGNTGTPSRDAKVETVVNRALSQLGVPYAWGGGDANGPTRGIRDGGVADQHGDYNKIGFDCSGLMIYAFAGIGKALPHYTGYQYTSGPQFPVAQRQRGDMLFWPGHVALYLGDGKMVEAPQSGDVVKISPVRMAGISPMVVRLV